jgi:hypothetical protein
MHRLVATRLSNIVPCSLMGGSFVLGQFCEVAEVAMIHRKT